MPKEGYKNIGGRKSLIDNTNIRGVYAQNPAMSPKFHTSGGPHDLGSTNARLYVEVQDAAARKALMRDKSLSLRARNAASVMSVYRGKGGGYRGALGGYVDFLLTGFSLQQSEQVQIAETLSDASAVYYFGRNTLTANISGIVYNTRQDNWYDAWMILYDEILRGTRLATRGHEAIMRVDSRRYHGSFASTSTQLSAANESIASFSATFIIKRVVVKAPRWVNTIPTGAGSYQAPEELVFTLEETGQLTDVVAAAVEQNDELVFTLEETGQAKVGGSKKISAVNAVGEAVHDTNLPAEERVNAGVSTGAIPDDDLETVDSSRPAVGAQPSPETVFTLYDTGQSEEEELVFTLSDTDQEG